MDYQVLKIFRSPDLLLRHFNFPHNDTWVVIIIVVISNKKDYLVLGMNKENNAKYYLV